MGIYGLLVLLGPQQQAEASVELLNGAERKNGRNREITSSRIASTVPSSIATVPMGPHLVSFASFA